MVGRSHTVAVHAALILHIFAMPDYFRKIQLINIVIRPCNQGEERNATLRRNYFNQIIKAWPDWCADHEGFKPIYKEAARRRKRGESACVDHIVPLRSPIVCGLHVPWNLQVITEAENYAKSNIWWPDCPYENYKLFDDTFEPYQLFLIK